jgi:hypothetical protein
MEQTDEPQLDAVGDDNAAGLLVSHGPVEGSGPVDFSIELSSGDYVAYWAWAALLGRGQ